MKRLLLIICCLTFCTFGCSVPDSNTKVSLEKEMVVNSAAEDDKRIMDMVAEVIKDYRGMVVVYDQIPFNGGHLVLLDKDIEGEHYPGLYFFDNKGKVAYHCWGYCWTLNYTEFEGQYIYFGLASAEASRIEHKERQINKIETSFKDKKVTAVPRKNIVGKIVAKPDYNFAVPDSYGYILVSGEKSVPDDHRCLYDNGSSISLVDLALQYWKDDIPDYLHAKKPEIRNAAVYSFSPMLTPEEWMQGTMEGDVALTGKTDQNNNLNLTWLRPAGHLRAGDEALIPKNLAPYILSFTDIQSNHFSPGEIVKLTFPIDRSLAGCYLMKLEPETVERDIKEKKLVRFNPNSKGEITLPKEKGEYFVILRTLKGDIVITYQALFKIM